MGMSVFSAALGALSTFCIVGFLLLITDKTSVNEFRRSGRRLMGMQAAATEVSPLDAPRWNGVLPDNFDDQQLPMVRNPHYGMHVIALGKNGSLFHMYQTGPTPSNETSEVPMSKWAALTPPVYKNTSGVEVPLTFANAPAIALNADGRIELFVAYKPDSLDIWQMYQTDAKNPLAWSAARAPLCDPAFKDCLACLNKPECKKQFWADKFFWTTSQQYLWLNPEDNKLRLNFRLFDGYLYELTQSEPSKSDHYIDNLISYKTIFE